jgi:putative phage-type endonuclease|tara:strand:+ start:1539 stop:2159 length:621 start_codon:yes stop_codon:yes gene_type:complete
MTTDHIQGSPAWHQARCGKVTASRVADVIAKTKTGWGTSRANYQAQLIAERLTGNPAETYSNAAMQWGTDTEPKAAIAYEFFTDTVTSFIGFIVHPTIDQSGASPDRLVKNDGLVEFKCPNTSTHIATLLGSTTPKKYLTQIQWQMACTGRKWTDYVSFDPRLPPALQLFVQRIERDDERIAELEGLVRDFLAEMDAKIVELEKLV